MTNTYFKVWETVRKELYHFIKLHNISKVNYTFEAYFNYITDKYKIKILPHHFSDEAILGLTLIDKLGISFSYEITSIPARQNFTKCHELGHLVLQHSGTVFSENENNKDWQEIESNYFASFILMPDIVLLSKIVYQKRSFQDLTKELKVSTLALERRLVELLYFQGNLSKIQAHEITKSYITQKPKALIETIINLKEKIIYDYESIKVDDIDKLKEYIKEKHFITQLDIPSLIDIEFQKTIRKLPDIEINTYYNQSCLVIYVWNPQKLTPEESLRKAKIIHYDLQEKRTS